MRRALRHPRAARVQARRDRAGAAQFDDPHHRPDITREVDLIEEVGRVRGYDAIPGVLPPIHPTPRGATREALSPPRARRGGRAGPAEASPTRSSMQAVLAEVGAPAPAVRLKNPLSEHQEVMRTSLLPGLFTRGRCRRRDVARRTRGSSPLGPFSSRGARGAMPARGAAAGSRAVLARRASALAREPRAGGRLGRARGSPRGSSNRLTGRAADVRIEGENERPTHLHPRGARHRPWKARAWERSVPLHPDVARALRACGRRDRVEIDLEAIGRLGARRRASRRSRASPRARATSRSSCRTTSRRGRARRGARRGRRARGGGVALRPLRGRIRSPEAHTSLAFRVVYRAADRTLTDAEVDAQHARVVAEVGARFGATLRA